MSVQYPTSVGVSESAGRPGAQDNAPPAVAEPVATPPAMAATRDSATAANPHTARPCAAARNSSSLSVSAATFLPLGGIYFFASLARGFAAGGQSHGERGEEVDTA